MRKKLLFAVISITLLFAASCGNQKDTAQELKFGVSAEYPPFEYYKDGTIQGFDIDLARLVAKELNKKAVFENMQFSAILPAIQAGRVDAGISAITITEERRSTFDFSIPYYFESMSIVFRDKDPLQSYSDFKDIKIGVQLGTTMEIWLKNNHPQARIVSVDGNNIAIESLKAGHVDVVLMDSSQAAVFSHMNKGLSIQKVVQSEDGYGIALNKNSELTLKINEAIDNLQKKGEIDKLKSKWLGEALLSQHTSPKSWAKDLLSDMAFIGIGIKITLKLLTGGILIGLVLGVCFAVIIYQNKPVITTIVRRFISVIRGTPLILQLSLIYFVFPELPFFKITAVSAGIITFGLNSSAYVTEILRAGIDSLPKGQFEAAKTLRIPAFYTWRDIILPQVVRNILPAMVNEVIALLKETALIATIGGLDLMRNAQLLTSEKFTYFRPLCIAGLYYYILVLFIEYIGKKIEKRGHYAENK